MKKYISLMAIAIVAIFASCSNDDITIKRTLTIKVDPSGVISPFPEEYPSELTSFDTSCKLRVRVLAYDDNGLLAYADSVFLNNYQSDMSVSTSLPVGKYTFVATTDVVEYSSKVTDEAWNLSEKDNINNTKIKAREQSGLFAGKYNILGITSQAVNISEDTQSVALNPTPAGALIRIYYLNVTYYTDVTYYSLWANRGSSLVSFDSNGAPKMTPENNNNQMDFCLSWTNVNNARTQDWWATYSWAFMFPVDNVNFQFYWTVEDAEYVSELKEYTMGEQKTISSLKAGEEWLIEADCYNNEIEISNYAESSARQFMESRVVPSVPNMLKRSEQKQPIFGFPTSTNQKGRKLKDLIR